jgi:hypothetical protein
MAAAVLVIAGSRRKPKSNTSSSAIPGTQVLAPISLDEGETFYGPTVTQANILLPSLIDDADTFYGPVIGTSTFISPPRLASTPVFFGPTVNQKIVVPQLNSSASVITPLVVQGVAPGLLTNAQTFYGPQLNLKLTPGLLTNTSTLYGGEIHTGTTLVAPLLDGSAVQYAPTLNLKLTLSLLTNTQTFPAPLVTAGVTLFANTFATAPAFYAPQVNMGLVAGKVTNNQTFYGPVISANALIVPALLTNASTIYAPAIGLKLTPPLVTNSQTFYNALVHQSAQILNAAWIGETQSFYGPRVNRNVKPPILANSVVIRAPTVSPAGSPGYVLSPPTYTATNSAGQPPQGDIALGADIYAGFMLRIQRSTDGLKGNDGSYVNQTLPDNGVLHLITPGDLATLSITQSEFASDGYYSPSGSGFEQMRYERDDGAISAWVEYTFNVTGSVATLFAVSGPNKSQYITVSGLNYSVNQTTGAFNGVKASIGASGKKHFELTVTGLDSTGAAYIGVADSSGAIGPASGAMPGNANAANGCTLRMSSGSAIQCSNGTALNYSLGTLAANDVIACEFDTNAKTVVFRRYRGGVLQNTGATITLTSLIPAGDFYAFVGGKNVGDTGTVNFGATSFVGSLGTGYSFYG